MSSTAEAAKNRVEIGKRHILDQRLRIERQRELIERLERDGSPDLVANAVRLLAEMEQACGRRYAAGQERLSEATVDEAPPRTPKKSTRALGKHKKAS